MICSKTGYGALRHPMRGKIYAPPRSLAFKRSGGGQSLTSMPGMSLPIRKRQRYQN
jgi:hypothetical protein